MDGWSVSHASARGRKHVAKGTPNQDAVGALAGGGLVSAAVADGHGARSMTRADRGAALAVVAMLDVLGAAGPAPDVVPAALVTRWRQLVDEDLAADPLGDDEPRTHYGTTAIGARLDRDGLLLVQVGDGDTVILTLDGHAHRPVPALPPPWPGGTNSLRFDDAEERVAVARLPADDVAMVLLATDGLDKRHRGDWHAEVAVALRADLVGRTDAERAAVVERLAVDAATFAADDTTIAVLLREGAQERS